MLLMQKCLKFTLGHFCFLNTKLLNNIKSSFKDIIAHASTQKVSGIEFPHVIYFTYSSLGLTLSLQLPKKESFFCTKCISIFPSQYKHSCEPITSKFKSWLFSILSFARKCWAPSWGETPRLIKEFFLVLHFVSICLDETHFLSPTIALFSIFGTEW